MDRYEYKLKMDQLKTLLEKKDYETAAVIADTINWKKIRNVNSLIVAGDIYAHAKRYEESYDILLSAYDRAPIGRMIIYRLAELVIKMGEYDEAEEYIDEFIELAPQDNLRFVLKYRLAKAKGLSLPTQIAILEELKNLEYSEEWFYELAKLYHKNEQQGRCVDVCDELILWFGTGNYVKKAMELKMLHQPLTREQEENYKKYYYTAPEPIKQPEELPSIQNETEDDSKVELTESAESLNLSNSVKDMLSQSTEIQQETEVLPNAENPQNFESRQDSQNPQNLDNPPNIPDQDTKAIKTEEISKALNKQIEEMQTGQQSAFEADFQKLPEELRDIFSYFVPVAGMEAQICAVLTGASQRLASQGDSTRGNILIQGGKGCGKTVLATCLIKALQKIVKRPNGKIGKIDAEKLNKKDITQLMAKVSGGCLIIEGAGQLSKESAVKLSTLLELDKSGILVVMEDTRAGIESVIALDYELTKKFTEVIKIPVFTSDELVLFGKAYAKDLDYQIDEMGVLALYKRISHIQRIDRPTTLTEVKEIIDEAIDSVEKSSIMKAVSIITSRRYDEEDYVILREKDFEKRGRRA